MLKHKVTGPNAYSNNSRKMGPRERKFLEKQNPSNAFFWKKAKLLVPFMIASAIYFANPGEAKEQAQDWKHYYNLAESVNCSNHEKIKYKIKYYEKSIALNSTKQNIGSYWHVGEMYILEDDMDKAVKTQVKALKLDINDAESWRHVAQALDCKNDLESAVEAWTQAIILVEDTETFKYNKSIYSKYGGDYDQKKELSMSLTMRAQDLETLQEYDNALKDIERVLKIYPGHHIASDMKKDILDQMKEKK